MEIIEVTALLYILWNIAVFFIYGFDKKRSKYAGRRISEKTLIICAFLFGAFGASLAMKVWRHKTKHLKFTILIPVALLINLGIIFYFVYLI